MAILAGLRILSGLVSLVISYETAYVRPEFQFSLTHPNGDKKSREELESEALEEPFLPWFRRLISRPAFSCEVLCLVTQILAIAKCMGRLDVEVGRYEDARPTHPLFWIAVALSSFMSVVELSYVDFMGQLAAMYGKSCVENSQPTFFRRVGSHLSIPLLSADDDEEEPAAANDTASADDVEEGRPDPSMEVGTSDISGDARYKAGWSDLLHVCSPDVWYIVFAFVFLLLAAVAQVFIPRFTGKILDSLASAFANDKHDGKAIPVVDVPGFVTNVKCLVLASIFCGIFSAARGSIFTVVGGRVNVRLRVQLMDSLLSQGKWRQRLGENIAQESADTHHDFFIQMWASLTRQKLEISPAVSAVTRHWWATK